MMILLHAGYLHNRLWLWGEQGGDMSPKRRGRPRRAAGTYSPYDAGTAVRDALATLGMTPVAAESVTLWLPTVAGTPCPSSTLIAEPPSGEVQLVPWQVTAMPLAWEAMTALLTACTEYPVLAPGLIAGDDLRYWALALRYAASLVARQQYLPGIVENDSAYCARWEPVFAGEDATRLRSLAAAMPSVARALGGVDAPPDTPATIILEAFITSAVDRLVRPPEKAGKPTKFASVHDQWLAALRAPDGRLLGDPAEWARFTAEVHRWREPLALSLAAPYRLVFRLEEPADDIDPWQVRYLVQPVDDPSLLASAADVWKARGKKAMVLQRGDTSPRDFLLAALGTAATLSPQIEASLHTAQPASFILDTNGAFQFLADTAPLLEGMGYGVLLPAWWTRRGAKLRLAARAKMTGTKKASAKGSGISLDDMVQFQWTVAVGDEELTLAELQALAAMKSPLVKLRGQWVELNQDDLRHALKLLADPRSETSGRELARMALGAGAAPGGLPVAGVVATGALGEIIAQLDGRTPFAELPPPDGLHGTLRPYQERGYSWLAFLRRWGLGACLADDMGLGKTVQTLALLERDREEGVSRPVLLICPTSVVNNWRKEAERFTPSLSVLIHHGAGRAKQAAFTNEAKQHALVISSYALLHRDLAAMNAVSWAGVILDEAQHIKNPETKVAKAAQAIPADYRIALTGTPVENHVGELWSIMEFLNPGLLGTAKAFRTNIFQPIQLEHDPEAATRLKRLTGPFLLRRLKTDRSIITDLPEKQEMPVYCPLTKEQASLYLAVTKEAEEALEGADGIQRKGLVLATLMKLKQVCNHPAQFLGDGSAIPGRSGKLERLTEMLEEIQSMGERALIFTQFTEMGDMLQRYLQETFGREVLFLHGGVAKAKRDLLVERFQGDAHAPSIFLLSLKAGGTGLNLTRANHVFHFDRWWNPAVENQATDRAFRIGQTKNVQVHKFICAGTLEEKISDMIERKREIAAQVVGAGEGWLTELSTAELKDLFALRADAVAE
ncbi:MAG TPA: DEAD/DEAH box helicase [Armatimonadota bacterium]|jgi:SNF2 family DNA or RNA helicase